MKKDDRVFLRHILESIEKIEEFTQKLMESDFSRQVQVQDAVMRRLEIIGEATKNISPGFRARHPSVPWREMARMRDKLTHDYFGVDIVIVWRVVKNELPKLKIKIEQALQAM